MENNQPSGFSKTERETNPETGTVSWDITYKANYNKLLQQFNLLGKEFKEFMTFDDVKKDPKFKEINSGFNYVYNQFRSHLRNNYPKEYKLAQLALKEILIKELIFNKLNELSSTGNGGSFTPGSGEQYDTPLSTKYKHIYEDESSDSYLNSINIGDPQLKQFIEDKITDFDKIEDKLNILIPLLKKAKTETMDYYKNNPDFKIQYSTDLASDYIDDLITLFNKK